MALSFIPKVFTEHLEAVGSAWTRRRTALTSPDYTGVEVSAVDEMVEAHFDGLAAGGEDSLPVVERLLSGDSPLAAFAGASAMLRIGSSDAVGRVGDSFSAAKGKKLECLRDALAIGPSVPLRALLMSHFLAASPDVGAAAGEVLSFQGAFAPTAENLQRFLRADAPSVRAACWRIVAYCATPVPVEWYDIGLRDDDGSVKLAALRAAAWNASPVFYPYCWALATAPTPESIDVLVVLAAVAPPTAYQVIESIGTNIAAGPGRYRVVGAFGHPYFIDFLLREMSNPAVLAEASGAFAKMTGRKAESAQHALEHWRELAPRLAHSSRICRGFDMSQPLERSAFALLDRESAWEFCLRMRLTMGWSGTPLTLERFPQRG